jgi:hypothetical protein
MQAEVALCQRYFARLGSLSGNYVGFAAGVAGTITAGTTYMQFPQAMRTMPAISASNVSAYDTSAKPVTLIQISNGGTTTARVYFECSAGGLTPQRAVVLCGNNNPNAYIDLNSEL